MIKSVKKSETPISMSSLNFLYKCYIMSKIQKTICIYYISLCGIPVTEYFGEWSQSPHRGEGEKATIDLGISPGNHQKIHQNFHQDFGRWWKPQNALKKFTRDFLLSLFINIKILFFLLSWASFSVKIHPSWFHQDLPYCFANQNNFLLFS